MAMLVDENAEIKYFRRSTSSSESKMDKIKRVINIKHEKWKYQTM